MITGCDRQFPPDATQVAPFVPGHRWTHCPIGLTQLSAQKAQELRARADFGDVKSAATPSVATTPALTRSRVFMISFSLF